MSRSRWRGFAEAQSLFDTLPAQAESAIKEALPRLGAEILAAQRATVPVRTGDLYRGLTIETLDGGLKIRVGLLGQTSTWISSGKTSYGGLYYGRFVEFGRHAQRVLVERRRRVGGRLRVRRNRKIAADLEAVYPYSVSAQPPRPFVYSPEAEAAALRAMAEVADILDRNLKD